MLTIQKMEVSSMLSRDLVWSLEGETNREPGKLPGQHDILFCWQQPLCSVFSPLVPEIKNHCGR